MINLNKSKEINAWSLMAIAHGSVSEETSVKLYKGVGAVGVLAVNPTRQELNAIYGNDNGNTEEINYLGTTKAKDADGNEVDAQQVRISFITRIDPAISCNNGIEAILPVNFFLTKAFNYSTKNGVVKVQVIDKYGRTAWVTKDELKAGAIPEYTIRNGERSGQTIKANISAGYRPAYSGEEDLVKFIQALLNIPRPDVWDQKLKTFVMKTDAKELAECECLLDNIKKYFDGDVKELKQVLMFQPNNRMKLAFGVRTTKNGTRYQCAYTRLPMRLSVMNFTQLEKALKEDAAAGRHPSEEYSTGTLEEATLTPTDYSKKDDTKVEDPFASTTPESGVAPSPVDDLPMGDDPFA